MLVMVCRKDAVHGGIKSSELFPVLVEVEPGTSAGEIVLKALREKWPNYTPKHKSYYVVSMDNALLVTFKPKEDYDIVVESA